ncbi:hypothetical protein CPB97_005696 [Podila verticillata]|nr:hypothetical protein CPB97_005696 [Podila verticillata]
MLQTVVNKTRKMHNIDNILHAKFKATSVTIEKTLQFKDAEEGELLAEIFRNETRISKLEARIKVLNEFLLCHNVNALEVLHEGRCYMDFGTEGWDKSFMLHYPETRELDFTIKARDLLCCNIETTREIGSKEDKELWRSWQGNFEHTSLQNSGLHVKIYATKADRHQAEIMQKCEECKRLQRELQVSIEHHNHHAQQSEGMKEQIRGIVENHGEGIQILRLVANKYLTPENFKALMDANAYTGNTAMCAKKVQEVYKALAKQNLMEQAQSTQESYETRVHQSLPGTEYSVLLLGEMQSGKSAFIEHIKNYANPDYTINQTLLGDGTFPKTERTHMSCATSNLPSYKVYKSGTMVKLKCLSKGPDNEDGDLLPSCDDSMEFKLSRSNLNDMPFHFLDTPGLCNYDDKDSSHAMGIIEGILSVQSFNLSLIAINLQNPLTAELLLALQYYSKVLDGLHNNIAFVFTHAHYDNYCLTDPRQNESYCLVHDPQYSKRHILAAVNSPSKVDTILDKEKIESITHPSHFDDQQHKEALSYVMPGAQSKAIKQSVPLEGIPEGANSTVIGDTQSGKPSPIETAMLTVKSNLGSMAIKKHAIQGGVNTADEILKDNTKPKCSMLLLGKSQSGKSSMIKYLRNYSDLNYSINQTCLGDGNTSKTESTCQFVFHSHLLAHEVVEKVTGVMLNLEDLGARIHDEDDYWELLKGQEGNTPGFNDTNHKSVAMADNIVQEIISTWSFNLILIIVSAQSPLSREYRTKLEYYAKVLQGLHANVAFLYTHDDYADCHHSNTMHFSNLAK